MPGIDFREARSQLQLSEVLELIGFEPRLRYGDEVRGPCPVHRSRTSRSRSFAAHLKKGVWHCFRCGAGGNVLDLWLAVTRQALHAGVIDLYTRLGREVPWLQRTAASVRRACRKEKPTMPDP
jgi:DNA primase